MAAIDETERTGASSGAEIRLPLLGGVRWFALAVSQKAENRFLILAHDVTERKSMEDALTKTTTLLSSLVGAIPDLIWMKDPRGIYLVCNHAFEQFFGTRENNVVGKSDNDFMSNEQVDCFRQRDPGKDLVSINDGILARKTSGETVVLEMRHAPVHGPNAELLGSLGIARDMTESKRIEAELHDKQRHLNAITLELAFSEQRERRRIASDIHDHLGQDLALTKIKIGSLNKTVLSEKQKTLLGEITRLTESAINYIRGLTRQLCPPVLESAGLEAALKWLARQLEKDHGLQIAFFDDRRNKPVAREYQLELYNSVGELLINIVKHGGTTSARLLLMREANMLKIMVEDDGAGFDADAIMNNPTIEGFGLYTIERRITHMQGSFRIHSTPGAGTQITILVPLETHDNMPMEP